MDESDTVAGQSAETGGAGDGCSRPLAPKKASQTCQPCRMRKVRCLPGDAATTVCANCDRLGFSCTFRHSCAHDGEAGLLLPLLPRRRVRLACISCHSRKARCTGRSPKCARCDSLGIACVYRPTKRAAVWPEPTAAICSAPGRPGAQAQPEARPQAQPQAGPDSDRESGTSEPADKRRPTVVEHGRSEVTETTDSAGATDSVLSLTGGCYASLSPDSTFTYPDEDVIKRTFNNFFRHVHHVPVFSFLHRASLMQRYHAGMMDKALLLALVGITSLFTDLGAGMRQYGSRCIDECQKMILAEIENPSTIKIQSLVFIMKYRMLTQKFTGAFMLAATAGRFSYALRLNHENENLCFLARESRRRLMWSLTIIDTGINGGYPDFTLLPCDAMHIQLPCNERNFEFDLPQVTGHLQPIPAKAFPDDVGSLALHVRLLWIRGRILSCSKNALAMTEPEIGELPRLVQHLAHELSGFYHHLPASFRFSESNLQLRAYSPRLCVFIMIHVWWRQCHCDLYRIAVAGLKEGLPRIAIDRLPRQFVAMCERQCFEHALAMADIFRSVLSLDGGVPVTDLDLPLCAYSCARVLYALYATHARDFHLGPDKLQEHVQRFRDLLRHMCHIPAGQAIYNDLEALIARGLSTSTSTAAAAAATPGYRASPDAARLPPPECHLPPAMLSPPVYQMPSPQTDHPAGPQSPPGSNNRPGTRPGSTTCSSSSSSSSLGGPAAALPADIAAAVAADMGPLDDGGGVGGGLASRPTTMTLARINAPEGLDNNNAFEGAMDGFDFVFGSFGNTGLGLDPASWYPLTEPWMLNGIHDSAAYR